MTGSGSGSVVTFGETMLLLTGHGPGAVADLDTMRVGTGGTESNTAIALAHAGVPVTWVGGVGDDPAGERVLRDIGAEGVTVVPVVSADLPTGLMMKERLPDGRTRVTYHRRGSAGAALRPTDLPDGLVERAALLHVTGITLAVSDSARDTVHAAVERARSAGVPVSFDVNHRQKLVDAGTARRLYREVVARSDLVFAGDDEARLVLGRPEPAVTGADDDLLAHELAALAAGTAVVTLGSRGAVVSADGVLLRRAPTPVRVVDPVGAGDAFVAAWLAAMLAGAPTGERLDRAADAGAHACTIEGDWPRGGAGGAGGGGGGGRGGPVAGMLPSTISAGTGHTPAAAVHDHVDR